MLELFGAIAAGLLVIFVPYSLAQVPLLKAAMSAQRDGDDWLPRSWARRVTGLAGIAGLPLYGFAFPYAALPATLLVFTKPLGGWPFWAKILAASSAAGVLTLAVSATYQRQEVSVNVLYYSAMALFVVAAVKLTNGEATAAQLLGHASIGSALFFVIFRPKATDTFEHMWKYGIGTYVAIVSLWLLCSVTHRRTLPVVALIVVGSASLFLGFRSHGLVCFITVIAVLAKGKSRKGKFPLVRVALAGAALLGLARFLPAAVEAGVFGEAVRLRTAAQIGEEGPALLAGRVEPPLSFAAVAERPVFGWGNLNGIDYDTLSRGADIAYSMGLTPTDFMHLWVGRDGQISVHSLLFEGWVEGGLAAAAMPLLLLGIFFAAIWRAGGNWAPLVILVSAQGIWDVLFSTWGYNRSFILAISAVLAVWAISGGKNEVTSDDGTGPVRGKRVAVTGVPGCPALPSVRR